MGYAPSAIAVGAWQRHNVGAMATMGMAGERLNWAPMSARHMGPDKTADHTWPDIVGLDRPRDWKHPKTSRGRPYRNRSDVMISAVRPLFSSFMQSHAICRLQRAKALKLRPPVMNCGHMSCQGDGDHDRQSYANDR
jgi:hypothetical protein